MQIGAINFTKNNNRHQRYNSRNNKLDIPRYKTVNTLRQKGLSFSFREGDEHSHSLVIKGKKFVTSNTENVARSGEGVRGADQQEEQLYLSCMPLVLRGFSPSLACRNVVCVDRMVYREFLGNDATFRVLFSTNRRSQG